MDAIKEKIQAIVKEAYDNNMSESEIKDCYFEAYYIAKHKNINNIIDTLKEKYIGKLINRKLHNIEEYILVEDIRPHSLFRNKFSFIGKNIVITTNNDEYSMQVINDEFVVCVDELHKITIVNEPIDVIKTHLETFRSNVIKEFVSVLN